MSDSSFTPTPLHKLIVFILRELKRELGAIELAKIIYLVDVESIKLLGRSISGDEYLRRERGPLPTGFYRAIEEMKGAEVNVVIHPRFLWPKHSHGLGSTIRFPCNFEPEIEAVVRRVLERLAPLRPRQIEQLAYETEPMMHILATEQERGFIIEGVTVDLSKVEMNQRLARWRENKARHLANADPEYEAFLEGERREAQEILAS